MNRFKNNKGNMMLSTISAVTFISISILSLYSVMNLMGNSLVRTSHLEQEIQESKVTLNHVSDTVKHLISENSLNIDKSSIEASVNSLFPNDEISITQVPTDSDEDISFDIDISIGYSTYYQNILIEDYKIADDDTIVEPTCEINLEGSTEWKNTVYYLPGDLIANNNSYYVNIKTIIGGKEPQYNANNWHMINSSCLTSTVYSPIVQYQKGEVVKYKDEYFIGMNYSIGVTPPLSSSPVIDYTSWAPVRLNKDTIEDIDGEHRVIFGSKFEFNTPYFQDEIIHYNNTYYVLIYDYSTSGFFTPDIMNRYFKELTSLPHETLSVKVSDIIFSNSKSYTLYDIYYDTDFEDYSMCIDYSCSKTKVLTEYKESAFFILDTENAKNFVKNTGYMRNDLVYNPDDNSYYILKYTHGYVSDIKQYSSYIANQSNLILDYTAAQINTQYNDVIVEYEGELYFIINDSYFHNLDEIPTNNNVLKIPSKKYKDLESAEEGEADSEAPSKHSIFFTYLGNASRGAWRTNMNSWSIGTICEYDGKYYYKFTKNQFNSRSAPDASDSRWYEISVIGEYKGLDTYYSNINYDGGSIVYHNDKVYLKSYCTHIDFNKPGTSSQCWNNENNEISWKELDDVNLLESLPDDDDDGNDSLPPVPGDIKITISDIKKRT